MRRSVAEELTQAARPVDRERELAAPERVGLEHARKPEVVIRVVVGEEDLLELDQADVAAQKLPLRSLGAVEEQPVSASPDERRGQGAPGSRCGPGRPEEDDVEIHAGRVYALKYRPYYCRYKRHGVPGVSLGWVD